MANNRNTEAYFLYQSDLFCKLQKITDLYGLLKINRKQFDALTQDECYRTFMVGKKSGGEREIENPSPELKKLQSNISKYLQATYYFVKTPIAHGYILNAKHEKTKRDIISNAQQHTGKPYLLNIDLKSFFQSIESSRVWRIFTKKPFGLRKEGAEVLTKLITYRGHLPTGAPTSPVVSNFAAMDLDKELYAFGQQYDLTVTRYVDDITFSGHKPITADTVDTIRKLVEKNNFTIHEGKVKIFEPQDTKEVTGLVVEDTQVTLPAEYITTLEKEIEQLATVLVVQNQQGRLNTQWVETFKQHIQGRLNFLGYVLGATSTESISLQEAFDKAITPPVEDFGSYSWRIFDYMI